MKRSVRLPSPAMVVALLALVTSVGGTVTAAVLITSADIQDNTIRSVDIRNETIRSADVDNGSLTGADVKNGSVAGVDVKNETLTGADVKDGSLTGADILASSLGQVPSAADAVNAGKVDGFDADALTRIGGMRTLTDVRLKTSGVEYGVGPTVSIVAPAAGFVVISGRLDVELRSESFCPVWAKVRHFPPRAAAQPVADSVPTRDLLHSAFQRMNAPVTTVFPVPAGVNKFAFRVTQFCNVGPGEDEDDVRLFVDSGELTAIYAPFGGTGATP
jgi:hypothetical protein